MQHINSDDRQNGNMRTFNLTAPLQTKCSSTITDSVWQLHYGLSMAAPLHTHYGSTIIDSVWQHHNILKNETKLI